MCASPSIDANNPYSNEKDKKIKKNNETLYDEMKMYSHHIICLLVRCTITRTTTKSRVPFNINSILCISLLITVSSVRNLLICNSSASLLFFVITYFIQLSYFVRDFYFGTYNPHPILCQITGCLATFDTIIAAYSCIVQAISRFFLTYRNNWALILTRWIMTGLIISLFLAIASVIHAIFLWMINDQ